ncbi:D-alanyl-D-alanine carboxypeptidase family protein [Lentilactobacillus kefiri]|uniref:D-alanyl-D-alanine carboxypeptidase n=1 Tax=Lentilactobacillus kefiri TaxID=33962 RepID=A0A511DWC8_LENKE|nr:D-alanyl-D-alanine carboxypeptidase family protein [Lentilactobacillus kefiri]MCJ2162605.1 D-alanyl-D-alanine carboxypeptidase [Lentilactobacillus kefiri]MCP9369811.1 D-alanyl-D-alanine carboxypeptidase [Lentilactobacillus kefiri]MDH5109239.1 D-alanyl-D-alanine carboxypeptidase [Lentilactobacillus kefiri]PAK58792.1 peptidase [Lentilactobacillus kefiri]PAK81393.1 peptidase [Lentilactobacillus kefiri]
MKHRFSLFIALMGFFCVLAVSVPASASSNTSPDIYAKAAIAVDAQTGQILYQKNAHQPRAIASISKLMTVYIVHHEIKQHRLAWGDKVKITSALARLSTASGLTNVPLKAGRSYTVRELVNATLVASANAAALALGQKVAGSSTKFAELMNQTAHKMGIKDGKFYNASGLTNKLTGKLALQHVSANAENMLSASDVALVAKNLLKQFPKVTHITKQTSGTFYGTQMSGHNQLIGDNNIAKGVQVDGLKTGTSDKAGACFVGSATQKGKHRIITVVLGARNKSASDPARFIQTAKLMRSVYTTQHPIKIAAGTKISGVGKVQIPDGKQESITPVTKATNLVWAANATKQNHVSGKFVKKPAKLASPTKKNTVAGKVHLRINDKRLQYIGKSTGDFVMVTKNSVKKANPFVRLWRAILRLF